MNLKGFRTLLLNSAAAVVPIWQAADPAALGLTGTQMAVYAVIIAGLNAVLRFFTTTPVGTSGQ